MPVVEPLHGAAHYGTLTHGLKPALVHPMPASSVLGPDFVARFDLVNSVEDGLALIWQHANDLDDTVADALLAKANELQNSGDPDGAAEFTAWGRKARSIVTRNELLATDVDGQDDALARLQARRDRFDDGFIETCAELAARPFGQLSAALDDGGIAAAQNLADQVTARVNFDLGFLKVVAGITRQQTHLAQAHLTEGCWLLLLAKLEELKGGPAHADLVARAAAALTACAENAAAPPLQRAHAENNLATLRFPDMQQVDAHQDAALRLAEQSGDWEAAREYRRHKSYWAREHGDWLAVYQLDKQSLDAAEAAVRKEYAPILAMRLVRDAWTDVASVVEACLKLGAQDPVWYERALEAAEWGKARAFLRAAMVVATSHRPVPERLHRRKQRLLQLTRMEGAQLGALDMSAAQRRLPHADHMLLLLGRTEAQIEKFGSLRMFDLHCFPCQFADMVKLVPAGGLILSYFELPQAIILFVLGEAGLLGQPVTLPLSRKELASVLLNMEVTAAIRSDFKNWNDIQRELEMRISAVWPTDKLQFLYHRLIKPIADRLEGRSLVYISPDGLLWRVPLHAALISEQMALIDQVPVAYAPGLAVLRRSMEADRATGLAPVFAAGVPLAAGGPDGAAEEAQAVAGIFGGSAEPATREAVLTRGLKADVFHISCHTDLENATTAFQGLMLEDGLLTSSEIIAARCQSSLAFLSACETSRADLHGEGEELVGITGAFLRAGCRSVISCMWKMPTSVSPELVKHFYVALVENKANRAVALQAAIQAVKQQPRFDHPYYWAPFCLYGPA
jgi:hypothetical protein